MAFTVTGRSAGRALLAVLVFLAGTAPFLAAVRYGLINLDDYWYLVMHDQITAGVGIEGLKFAFTCLEESIWMPLTWLSCMVDHSLFGMGNWAWFHVHSILLHGVNAVLVYGLLLRIAGFAYAEGPAGHSMAFRRVACAIGAAVWACHPLRVESVVWLACRKDVLSFLFELLAMHFWFMRGEGRGEGRVAYWAAILCFALAGMAKPSVMTFPLLCLLVELFVRRRVRPLDYALPFALAAALGWFAGYAQAAGGATENVFGMPFWYRIANAAVSFGIYLLHEVWPFGLAPQCLIRYPAWPRLCVLGILVCAGVGGWLAWRCFDFWRRREELVKASWRGWRPEWTFTGGRETIFPAFAWFALAVAPMLGIAGFGFHAQADRFTYIPAVGLSAAVAFSLAAVRRRARRAGVAACAVYACVCAALGVQAARQTSFWRDDLTLFTHTLAVDGDRNALAHGVVANWHFEFSHDLEACAEHFRKATGQNLRFVEQSFEVYVFALCELGRTGEIPALLKRFDEWVFAIEENPHWGKESYRARFARNVYQFARVAYLITQPDLRAAAAELLAEATCPKDDPTFLYLKWRLALAEGNEAKAECAKRDLLEKESRKGYTLFRYLRKDATSNEKPERRADA